MPTVQFFIRISRNTQSHSYLLSMSECVWDFQNNAFWDIHQHALFQSNNIHGQWVLGSSAIRVIGGVRKGIRPQFLSPQTRLEKRPTQGISQGVETLNGHVFF